MTVTITDTLMEYDTTDLGGDSIENLQSILCDLTYRRQVVSERTYRGPETIGEIDADIARVTRELEARS
jgi:hypothetical protein